MTAHDAAWCNEKASAVLASEDNMSDFSSIDISPDFALLPADAKHAGYFQCKDLPDDPAYGACIGGEVEADGRFVRTDSGVRQLNPNLNGWIGLRGA